MVKQRTDVPKAIKNWVLAEYNHRCALGGEDNPQLHHIDGDPTNHDLLNLIPLCPNCHLIDQHRPTRGMDVDLLRFFRRHKHLNITNPQFKPVFRRMQFLDAVEEFDDARELQRHVHELVGLVKRLNLGEFFAERIGRLLRRPGVVLAYDIMDPRAEEYREREYREELRAYREQVNRARDQVHALIVEMLDFQDWSQQGRAR